MRFRPTATSVRRAGILGLLIAGAVMALGARCIERTTVYVDKDGYTHIVGEMVNETAVQGTAMMLQGTLYDSQDNIIAQKIVPTCPPDTQPNSQVVFDVRFDNPSVPPHARYDVRAVGGKALPNLLPSPDVVILRTDAIRFEGFPPIPELGISDSDVLFQFGARNRSGVPLAGIQGCAAVYNSAGDVTRVVIEELIQLDDNGNPVPAVMGSEAPGQVFMVANDVPPGALQVRAWLWFGPKGAPTSQWQFVQTPFITIQTIRP